MFGSFKLGNILGNLDRHHRSIGKVVRCSSATQSISGKQTPAFFRNQEYLDDHRMFGYQYDAWEFYRAGKEESVRKCEEIELIIDAYEKAILTEIERDIQTSTGNQKLERKNTGMEE